MNISRRIRVDTHADYHDIFPRSIPLAAQPVAWQLSREERLQ
jgi:hypothetical protein